MKSVKNVMETDRLLCSAALKNNEDGLKNMLLDWRELCWTRISYSVHHYGHK